MILLIERKNDLFKGKNKDEKLNIYFTDMEIYCSEISKVLKRENIV